MLTSPLFAGDPVLEAVAADTDRISRTQHRKDPAVGKVQTALLDWDPTCLPKFGADSDYGDETAGAVRRFKIEVLGVDPASVIDDVGPRTVIELDRMQSAKPAGGGSSGSRVGTLDGWLNLPMAGWSSDVASSAVRVHISGDSAFQAFHDAVARCASESALIVISGWDFYDVTQLTSSTTVGSALSAATGRGARVRAMFAHFPVITALGMTFRIMPGDNTGAVAFINGLPNGAAIHDAWVLHHVVPGVIGAALGPVQLGIHHQKAWAVFDGERLLAWCGGMDFNPNRVGPNPLHDVQAEVEGPAAQHVYELLRDRWNNHPAMPAGTTLPALAASMPAAADQRTRVATTFGDPTQFAGLGPGMPAYPFATAGSKTVRDLVFHAIDTAQTFIYVEDQYLVDEELGIKLAAAMPHLQALIIVICDTNAVNGELFQAWARRKRLLDHLTPFAAKVAVVQAKPFVHAKIWVFDDEVAVVGSANINRRGFKHDSEADMAFGDLVTPGEVISMRQQLWSKHLGSSAPPTSDPPEASLPLWQSPPPTANVVTYNPTASTDPQPVHPTFAAATFTVDEFWDIVDPDCP